MPSRVNAGYLHSSSVTGGNANARDNLTMSRELFRVMALFTTYCGTCLHFDGYAFAYTNIRSIFRIYYSCHELNGPA